MPDYVNAYRAPVTATKHSASGSGLARDHLPAADTLAASLNQSPRAQSLTQLRAALDESPRVQSLQRIGGALNRMPEQEEAEPEQLQPDAIAQFAAMPNEAGIPDDPQRVEKKPNATGLPDRLKAGVESLSGLALDDVRVHYNSHKPAAVQAHAYARGTDIHVAPGQEKHLPHEAWHVVQQKQGRVKPTLQAKGVAINDDAGLEREADRMGRQAVNSAVVRDHRGVDSSLSPGADSRADGFPDQKRARTEPRPKVTSGSVQRIIRYEGKDFKQGKAPAIHGVKGLKPLANSSEVCDLDDVQHGATVQDRVNYYADKIKGGQVTPADKERNELLERFEKKKGHIAGEKSGTGGHLLKLMEEEHEDQLYWVGTPNENAVWACEWSLRKESSDKTKEAKEAKDTKSEDLQFKPKSSTMFPSSWDWDRLMAELRTAEHIGGVFKMPKYGLKVTEKGKKSGTFFPEQL